MKIALVSPYDFAYPGGVVNHISALERSGIGSLQDGQKVTYELVAGRDGKEAAEEIKLRD